MRNLVLVLVGLGLAIWVGFEIFSPKSEGDRDDPRDVRAAGKEVKEIPVGVNPDGSPVAGQKTASTSSEQTGKTGDVQSEPLAPSVKDSSRSLKPDRQRTPSKPESLPDSSGEKPLARSTGIGTQKAARALEAAEELVDSKRPLEAMQLLTRTLFDPALASDRKAVHKSLDEYLQRFFFSKAPLESGVIHHVLERGDTLDRLCRSWKKEHGWNIAPGFVCKLNRIRDPRKIRAGDRLKVVTLPLHILVSKSAHRLTVFVGDVAIKEYGVGLGKDNCTPEGSFLVKTKQIDPPWTWEGKTIPAGDKENILGTRWMGFENRDDLFGYGIHGTTKPESIGYDQSNGCVRMRNEEVEELFEWVPRGTKVTIRP